MKINHFDTFKRANEAKAAGDRYQRVGGRPYLHAPFINANIWDIACDDVPAAYKGKPWMIAVSQDTENGTYYAPLNRVVVFSNSEFYTKLEEKIDGSVITLEASAVESVLAFGKTYKVKRVEEKLEMFYRFQLVEDGK